MARLTWWKNQWQQLNNKYTNILSTLIFAMSYYQLNAKKLREFYNEIQRNYDKKHFQLVPLLFYPLFATALFWWTAVNNQESETLILQRELKCRLLKSASHLILDSGLVKQTTTLLAPPLPSSDDQHLSQQDNKVKCAARFLAQYFLLKNPPRMRRRRVMYVGSLLSLCVYT